MWAAPLDAALDRRSCRTWFAAPAFVEELSVLCWSGICRLGSIQIGSLGLINTLPFDHESGSPESLLGLRPDINKPPIKHLVRKAGARVREALVEAIGRALRAVTIEDAAGWFAHAGYWPQDQSL